MDNFEIKEEKFDYGEDNKEEIPEQKFRSKRDQLRRKQKRHISNLKGFSRKGIFGRGTELDAEQGEYFVKISEVIRNEFDTIDDKTSLSENVLSTCKGNEINYSSNQVASRVIENLLPYASDEIFNAFLNEFCKDFRPICSDPFASHVLQKLIEISFIRGVSKMQTSDDDKHQEKKMKFNEITEYEYNLTTKFSDDHIKNCYQFVIKSSKFLLNNLEDFVWDDYANHIIRSCLSNLVGKTCKNREKKKFGEDDVKYLNVPDEWKEIAVEYANRLFLWPQLPEFPYSEYSSGILQSLFEALKICDKNQLKSFGKKIVNQSFILISEDEESFQPNNKLPKVFSCESSIRLLESLIKIAGNKLLHEIYIQLFEKRLEMLSKMRSVNFAVQKLIDHVKDVADFELIFDEISPEIESLLKIGYTGVVLSLAQACLRLKTKQGGFIKALQTALHCHNESKEIVELFPLLVLKLKPYKIYKEDKSNFIHTHGSLILQAMLCFNKPITIVNNLLNLKNDDLANIFKTPAGSRVADAFVTSKTIGDKSREKLIRHMQGTYLDLVLSRNGSRAFEALFNAAGDKQKEYLMKELSEKCGLLSGSPTGKLISYKYKVNTFVTSQSRWKSEFLSKK